MSSIPRPPDMMINNSSLTTWLSNMNNNNDDDDDDEDSGGSDYSDNSCIGCGTDIHVLPMGYCEDCLTTMLSSSRRCKKKHQQQQQQQQRDLWVLRGSLIQKSGGNCGDTGNPNVDATTVVRTVTVADDLAKHLKPHQKEGVEFIWQNSFVDCNYYDNGNETEIGGCIVAHYMGLGKSLTTITLLHTVLTHPSLISKTTQKPLFRTVLMVVPVNTLYNWENEVMKWTGNLRNNNKTLNITNLGATVKSYREKEVLKWQREGGLLVLGDSLFRSMNKFILNQGQPDILVLDEAHTMLKNSSNKIFTMLNKIKTKRRIMLTGTPLQNNTTELYHMVEFVRPKLFGVKSEYDFEMKFRKPIEQGLPSDATADLKQASDEKQKLIQQLLAPHVHRKGRDVLQADLPELHDTLVYLQPSQTQSRILRLCKRGQNEGTKSRNFLSYYHDVAPVLNHPGCLKVEKLTSKQTIVWKSPDKMEEITWLGGLKDTEMNGLQEAWRSPKFIALAHILAMALQAGEKTLIYSNCLKTLDLVEYFFASKDWKTSVASLKYTFQNLMLGDLKRNRDYVRIDGSVESGKRGCLVDRFNEPGEAVRVFLISSLAGGVGINLTSATRIVMLDNHFNPAVAEQCIARAHRYGQTKTVHCYRLAIDGTVESKVYARAATKTSVALRVLDDICTTQSFSTNELADLQRIDFFVTCRNCGKTRLLPEGQDPPEDEDQWSCEMNMDPFHNSCNASQEFASQGAVSVRNDNVDPTLAHLVRVVNTRTKRTPIVKKWTPIETYHKKAESNQAGNQQRNDTRVVPDKIGEGEPQPDVVESSPTTPAATMGPASSPFGKKKRTLSPRSLPRSKDNEGGQKKQRVVATKMEEYGIVI